MSQKVGQGTVSPTHFVVVSGAETVPPDAMQRLSYMLTHMYYNWPGTVRVPAPCQVRRGSRREQISVFFCKTKCVASKVPCLWAQDLFIL